jgi:hypothetical protein
MGEMSNVYTASVGNLKARDQLGDLDIAERIMLSRP